MRIEPIRFQLSKCLLREWRRGDEPSLVRHANNRNIWLNVRDTFPHPYSRSDALDWVQLASGEGLNLVFAIDIDGFAVGAVGLRPGEDVNRLSAEIGYWLGEEFWGRGIATEALVAVTRHAIATHGLTRVYAVPFAWNAASCRVLEKAGYVLEARLRHSAIKNGELTDQMQYAYIPNVEP
jgi:RimJ/RimL family protein N-acetyltransferase